MSNSVIYKEISEGIVQIEFNRPEVYNSFNEELGKEFISSLKKAEKDRDVKVIIIRGAGDKAFNAGQDIKEVISWGGSLKNVVKERYNLIARILYNYSKPVICGLNGVAAGAGAGVALACDYIVASENSSMLFAFINIGLAPDTGVSYILPKIVGIKKAYELLTSGRKINAEELLKLNMVNEVVPYNKLDDRLLEVATEYSLKPPVALRLIKKSVLKGFCSDFETALLREEYYQRIAGRTHDFQEGIKAFVEKRKPKFIGK